MRHVTGPMLAAFVLLGGCAAVERIAGALANVARQFEDQPAAYVARVVGTGTADRRYLIDRVIIAENREGRAADVRFEGLREPHVRIPGAQFAGAFTDLSLRPDNARLAAIAEERIDVLEHHILISDTTRDGLVLATTALAFESVIARTCGPTAQAETELAFFVTAEYPDEDFALLDVTWLPGGRRFGPDTVLFTGWTASGDALFDQQLSFAAEVRRDGTLLPAPGGGQWRPDGGFQRVQVSADTGDIVTCTPAPPVMRPDPLFRLQLVPVGGRPGGLAVLPTDGSSHPLYGLTGGTSRPLLRFGGQVDPVVPPY